MTERVKATKILVHRAEGRPHECRPWTFHGPNVWDQARAQLQLWSFTAPRDGTVDKTDFTVTYEDGTEYTGCFGLKYDDTDLAGHIRGYLQHMVAHRAVYERNDINVDDVVAFLDTYEIGAA